jgi:DNA-binding HxlR family transcriptional regulator
MSIVVISQILSQFDDSIYQLGEPWKRPNAAGFLIPIQKQPPHHQREYLLLQEVESKVSFRDSGSISGVDASNKSGKHVFIRKGTMLQGKGTQSRAPIHSFVLANDPAFVRIPVNCIHQSHGISRGAQFKAQGVTPHSVQSNLGEQSSTWNSIRTHAMKTRELSSGQSRERLDRVQTDNLLQTEQVYRQDPVADALKNIPGDHINQVGVVVFDLKGVVAVELFDHPDSWHAFSKNIIRSYSEILNDEAGDLVEIKTDRAEQVFKRFIEKRKKMERVLITENKVSKIFALSDESADGELTELNGAEIHLQLYRRETPMRRSPPYGGRIQEPYGPGGVHVDYGPTGPDEDNVRRYIQRRGGFQILDTLNQESSRFKELLENVNVSRGTLASRIKEAEEIGLIEKGIRKTNGSPAYVITEKGKDVKEKAEDKAK